MLEQIFGALEALGQFLADGLLDHALAGEADQRVGLGQLDVAEHGVGGGHPAGGGIGQHDDVGQAGLLELGQRDGGARHLHQRQDPLLHPRATGGGEQHVRRLQDDRGAHPGEEGGTDANPH